MISRLGPAGERYSRLGSLRYKEIRQVMDSACVGAAMNKHVRAMDEAAVNAPSSKQPLWLKRAVVKISTLVIVGLVFGWIYGWGVPRLYGPDRTPGFYMGIVHGALMPIALPSLLMGKDVPIYTAQNTGRTYKIGYIGGINLCGLIFFGLAFHRPKEPKPLEDAPAVQ